MKNNFIYTIIGLIIICVSSLIYIVLFIPPNDGFVAIVLGLIFLVVMFIFALLFTAFIKPKGYLESTRTVFRRGLKLGLLISAIVIILLLIQINFDLI